MILTRRFFVCCLAVGVLALEPHSQAQDAVLSDFYGRGVHQYFAGNMQQAIGDLTRAIDGGTKDPRAYYFRALAQSRCGDSWAAESDFRIGAALESADVNQFYPVGRSLERVQGSSRMALERYRSVARAEAYQRRHERDLLRYEQRRRAESEVLRRPGTAPAPAAGGSPAPAAPAAPPEPTVDPFADEIKPPAAPRPPADTAPADEMPAEEAPAEEAAPAEPTPEEDPFADDPK